MNEAMAPVHGLIGPGSDSWMLDQQITLVTFSIQHQQYGLPIDSVLQVVRLPALVSLAGAPERISGLLNLHGQYLPVLNGHVLVNVPPSYDLTSQVIIIGQLQVRGRNIPRCGLLVDCVQDVQSFQRTRFTTLENGAAAPFLSGVLYAQDTAVLVCDVNALLALVPHCTMTEENGPTSLV